MPLGVSLWLGSENPYLVRLCLWPGHGEPAPLLHLSHAAVMSISFNSTTSLSLKGPVASFHVR